MKAYCAMKGLSFVQPKTDDGFSVKSFVMNTVYKSKVNDTAFLPLKIRLLAANEFKTLVEEKSPEMSSSDLDSLFPNLSQVNFDETKKK